MEKCSGRFGIESAEGTGVALAARFSETPSTGASLGARDVRGDEVSILMY